MALEINPDGVVVNTDDPQALADLNALLSSLPGYGLLTNQMKLASLNGALVPDAAGVWPGQPDYAPTYDIYFAALGLLGFLQAQPVVRQSSSEGSSISVDAPNWGGLANYYRGMSQILSGTHSVLQAVPIPDGPHVVRTDMSGRWGGNGDVDTDLA